MNEYLFSFHGAQLAALPSGALWWGTERVLCVSDLHLGKSDRIARRSGAMLPPYETRETLSRLAADIEMTGAATVVCLGDSFDDLAAARDMDAMNLADLAALMAGRQWVWIEGNHDTGPIGLGGTHRAQLSRQGLTFRHIATTDARAEISGHYHPKARVPVRGRTLSRRCFLLDADRLILPAYGTYTGGLFSDRSVLSDIMQIDARAILLPGQGGTPLPVPMPR
jgi:hypothetical protein